MEVQKIQALKVARGNFDLKMQISENVKTELTWWVKNIHNQYRVLNRNNPQVVLQTDASLLGWGAVMNDIKTGGRWNYDEKENHINYLELLAVFYALKAFQCQWNKFNHVKILSDNTTAVSYINHKGGVKSPCCNSLAKSIWFWAKQHKIWLTASHIAGKDNITADIQSRKFNDQVEWQLNKEIFKHICSVCGTPNIGLFASCLNTQLEKFCAWKPDPDASFIDAFSIDWSEYKCYMFRPFSLFGQMCKESTGRQDHSDTGGSTMADSSLVFTNNADVDRHSNIGSSERQFVISSIQRDSSSAEENYELDDLSNLWEQFTCKGISTKTANIMLCSWRQGTKKTVQSICQKMVSVLWRKED